MSAAHTCLQATIEVPYFEDMSWPSLLKLRDLVDEGSKAHTPISSLAGTIPGLKMERFTLQPSWFELTPQQQYELWLQGKQPGATGFGPDRLSTARLFGPQYAGGTPPLFFFDHKGQPLGENKKKDQLSLFGTRPVPIYGVPDHLAGQLAPAVSITWSRVS